MRLVIYETDYMECLAKGTTFGYTGNETLSVGFLPMQTLVL